MNAPSAEMHLGIAGMEVLYAASKFSLLNDKSPLIAYIRAVSGILERIDLM